MCVCVCGKCVCVRDRERESGRERENTKTLGCQNLSEQLVLAKLLMNNSMSENV